MPSPTKLSPPDSTGRNLASVMSLLIVILLAGSLAVASNGRPANQGAQQHSAPAKVTKHWKLYRSQKYGIQLRYPPDWTVIENKDYVGFRDPAWDKPSWKIGGSTVTVEVWRNVTLEKALADTPIETQKQARRYGDEPMGGFGKEKYIFAPGAAGPPVPVKESRINGLPALVAGVPTRLYLDPSGYAGAADGKIVFLMGHHAYAELFAMVYSKAFDAMVASFRFTR